MLVTDFMRLCTFHALNCIEWQLLWLREQLYALTLADSLNSALDYQAIGLTDLG